jgi:hypothetical protein
MTRSIAAELRAGALCALLLFPPASAPAGAADLASERITLEFAGSISHLPVMRAMLDAEVGPERYAGDLTFRSAGLAGFFKTARVEGRGEGRRSAAGFAPETYEHTEINGEKRRDISLDFEPEDVLVAAEPPFGSLGDPAPTPEQKRAALDPLAMVLEVALGAGDEPCSRVVPVFDSKLRYDLEFHPDGVEDDLRTAGYRGPAVRCRVYYRPIAGYDPEDLADEEVYAIPITVWLAEVSPGVFAPALIRARYDVGFFPLVVALELREAHVSDGKRGGSG